MPYLKNINATHTPYAIGIDVKLILSKMCLHGRYRTRIIQCTQVVVMCGKVISATLSNSNRLHHS